MKQYRIQIRSQKKSQSCVPLNQYDTQLVMWKRYYEEIIKHYVFGQEILFCHTLTVVNVFRNETQILEKRVLMRPEDLPHPLPTTCSDI